MKTKTAIQQAATIIADDLTELYDAAIQPTNGDVNIKIVLDNLRKSDGEDYEFDTLTIKSTLTFELCEAEFSLNHDYYRYMGDSNTRIFADDVELISDKLTGVFAREVFNYCKYRY